MTYAYNEMRRGPGGGGGARWGTYGSRVYRDADNDVITYAQA